VAGTPVDSSSFTIDNVAPSAPSVPDLAAADDTGDSNTDNITKNTSALTFTGTAEADATVQLYDGASQVGSSTTATGGNWSIDLSLAEASYSINAKATDASGNESSASGNLSVTIDTSAPTASAPTSTGQTLKSTDTSTSTVQSTEAGNIYLVKNGTAASTQAEIDTAVTANNAFLGKSSAAAATPYMVTLAAGLNDGVYDIVAVDAAENVSSIVAGWLTVDNTAPTATNAPTAADGPLINASEEAAGFDVVVGLGSSGAVAGDTLKLLLGGAAFPTPLTRVLTGTDISNTSYTFTVATGQLGSDGAKAITGQVTDVAGNVGAASTALNLTLDTAPDLDQVHYRWRKDNGGEFGSGGWYDLDWGFRKKID